MEPFKAPELRAALVAAAERPLLWQRLSDVLGRAEGAGGSGASDLVAAWDAAETFGRDPARLGRLAGELAAHAARDQQLARELRLWVAGGSRPSTPLAGDDAPACDAAPRDPVAVADGGVRNTVDGHAHLSGPVVQAHGIRGGIHFHAPPTPRAAATARQLLPAPPDFINRSEELSVLDALAGQVADAPAIVVISGPAGVGKTALASYWLRGRVADFPDGQLYADLRGHSSADDPAMPTEILGRFLRALGVTELPQELGELAALWRSHTAGLRIAVMLDNALSAAQVRPLLPGTARSLVAVTSRFRLAGLGIDGAVFQPLGVLDQDEAVELLSRRIGSARVRREPEAARRLVSACAGLPLAVCVVAARMAVRPRQPLAAMAGALDSAGAVRLEELGVEGEYAVRAALDASYRHLTAEPAGLYRKLSLPPVTVITAPVAAAACDVTHDEAHRLLDALAEVNLLEDLGPGLVTGLDRYRFHDLIRVHAASLAQRSESADERRRTIRRVVDHFLATATAAEALLTPSHRTLARTYASQPSQPPPFTDAAGALAWLDGERSHLMAAVRTAAEHGWDATAWQLVDAMWPLFLRLRPYDLWMAAHETGLAAARREGDREAESRMLTSGGTGLRNAGRHDDALAWFAQARAAAVRDGDRKAEAQALHGLGQSHRIAGRLDRANEFFCQALELREAIGYDRGAALTRLCLGDVALADGRPGEAVGHLSRARDGLVAAGDPYDAARALAHLGRARAVEDGAECATATLRQALAEFEEQGSVHWQGRVLEMLGETAAENGDAQAARGWYERSLAAYAPVSSTDVRRLEARLNALGG